MANKWFLTDESLGDPQFHIESLKDLLIGNRPALPSELIEAITTYINDNYFNMIS